LPSPDDVGPDLAEARARLCHAEAAAEVGSQPFGYEGDVLRVERRLRMPAWKLSLDGHDWSIPWKASAGESRTPQDREAGRTLVSFATAHRAGRRQGSAGARGTKLLAQPEGGAILTAQDGNETFCWKVLLCAGPWTRGRA